MKVNKLNSFSNFIVLIIMLFCSTIFNTQNVQAAAVKVQSKVVAYTDMSHSTSAEVYFAEKGDHITNLKSSSSNLKVVERYYVVSPTENKSSLYFYAKKSGTYKVTFDVYKADNKKRSHHSITVYACDYKGLWKVDGKYFGKNEFIRDVTTKGPYYFTSASSGKITFVAPKGCKLVKLEKYYYNTKGDKKTQKISNGQKVSFNRASNEITATTYFRATYKDTYSNTTSITPMQVMCLAK